MRSATIYTLDQIPRSLKYVPDEDWLVISYDNYDCMDSGNKECMYFTAFDVGNSRVEIEGFKLGGAIGAFKTFSYASDKSVYIANADCSWDEDGNRDFGALYELDFSGSAATVPINLVPGVPLKSYFGTALSADESVLYVSRGCCTDVCKLDDVNHCADEVTCSEGCDEHFLASEDKLDCKEACYNAYSCRRDTSSPCPTVGYNHTCPKKCLNMSAGDCISRENRVLYFDTTTMTQDADSPIELTEDCNGAGFMALDETRNRLYVSCRSAGNISIVDLSVDPPATSTVSVGGTLGDVALSAGDDYLFVSNRFNDTVSMIDLDTKTVTKTFKTADYPAGIAVHYPYIYVTNVLSGSVSKIDYTAASTAESSRAAFKVGQDPAPAAGNPVTNSFHSVLGH